MDLACNIYQKLIELECPFTWDMKEYPIDGSINYDLLEGEICIPEVTFMRYIMDVYHKTINLEYLKAEGKLEEAEKIILKLNRSSKEVAEHIFNSTKIHLLIKTENLNDEVEKKLQNIKSIKADMYNSLLNQFKSCAWSLTYELCTLKIAVKFAKLSVEQDPEAATSHFLVAKNLRSIRRNVKTIFSIPEENEIYHFTKAYELSKNPHFGLFFGQAFKESQDNETAYKILEDIYKMNLENPYIQMRLALAFIQMYHLEFAEKCLNYAESVIPEDSMFLHYKGLLFMKKNKYQEAARYLKKAAEVEKNYPADMSYYVCMRKSGKKFDATGYFINMLEKYSHCENPRKQQIYLHIAFSFYQIKRDIRESIKYFLLAFEIKTEVDNLKNYRDLIRNVSINVYSFLKEDLLPKVKHYRESKVISFSEETLSASDKLEGYLENYEA